MRKLWPSFISASMAPHCCIGVGSSPYTDLYKHCTALYGTAGVEMISPATFPTKFRSTLRSLRPPMNTVVFIVKLENDFVK